MGIHDARRSTFVSVSSNILTPLILITWIIEHPSREKVFPKSTDNQIANALQQHLDNKTVIIIANESVPLGILLYDVEEEFKTIHIVGIITENKSIFEQYIQLWKNSRYKNWTLRALRAGKLKTYKISNFI